MIIEDKWRGKKEKTILNNNNYKTKLFTQNYYFFKFYLFTFWFSWVVLLLTGFLYYSEWGLLSSCSAQVSYCGGFSHYTAWALGTWVLVAEAHGISCSTAHGIFPDQGSICVSCIGRWIFYHWATREAPLKIMMSKCVIQISIWRRKSTVYFIISFSNQIHSIIISLAPKWLALYKCLKLKN